MQLIANILSRESALLVILIISTGFLLYGAFISLIEKEFRASQRLAFLAVGTTILLGLPLFLSASFFEMISKGLILLFVFGVLLLVFPTRMFESKNKKYQPKGQINEKNVMFSRKLLEPGTERFEDYYKEFPEHREPDNRFRTKPGLLNEKASFYDPYTFTASHAIFEAITSFYPIVDGEPETAADKSKDPAETMEFINSWVRKEGAVSVGITEMQDYHWYSSIGRGPDFGKKAQLPHTHAIAFTVEMDKEMMDAAPYGPTVLESARQYMRAAVIATDLAMYIRRLGYNARAHIDGNYRLVCSLVARDAGLGEVGRMGLLMTPELGPRVRIGVVTTDMPLPASPQKDFSSMISFCRICKKCADVCPSRAIPFDDRQEIDGVKRWQINQEACYTLWCICGTDCGKCMSDCPYSHPNNLFHNIVRAMINNSLIFRYFALKMDDFLYGRKPRSRYDTRKLKLNTRN